MGIASPVATLTEKYMMYMTHQSENCVWAISCETSFSAIRDSWTKVSSKDWLDPFDT